VYDVVSFVARGESRRGTPVNDLETWIVSYCATLSKIKTKMKPQPLQPFTV
jgi:hypothetical protein